MRKIILFVTMLVLLTIGACAGSTGVVEEPAVNDAADAYIQYCD